ncbi:FCD domain-containing protein [Bifidobacterium sp. ESL0690]|uniref:FadR/GntR family transcriptional regulator n=1 Tax=Bifidobacterium sp. ESL0690 TaxID=2983214 RepID=UPI0023F7FE4A|nr:FCD domain-containing protein [Bifidobacterium sp. ESL0690]WEV47395.1 FCD domain-containing protein [Bifidobacterium sp. ESL0690]
MSSKHKGQTHSPVPDSRTNDDDDWEAKKHPAKKAKPKTKLAQSAANADEMQATPANDSVTQVSSTNAIEAQSAPANATETQPAPVSTTSAHLAPVSATEAQPTPIPMHHDVAEKLAIDIIENRWKPGTSITLNDIQERFSISRTVAREAAHALQSANAVIVRKRVGLIAQELDKWQSLDTQVIEWKLHSSCRKEQLLRITELRLAVEPVAAEDAAMYAPMETKALMPVLASQMRKDGESGNLTEFHKLDTRFHNEILTHSGNELFTALSPLVDIVLKSRVEQGLYPARPRPDALDAHEKVAEGIWKGDAKLARKAMTHIVSEVRTTTQHS